MKKKVKNISILVDGGLLLTGSTAVLFSILEAITYPGFLLKHLGFSIFWPVILYILFGLSFSINNRRKRSGIYGLNATYSLKILLILTILYTILNQLEKITYDNFVFSKFHLHYKSLILPVLLVFFFTQLDSLTKFFNYLTGLFRRKISKEIPKIIDKNAAGAIFLIMAILMTNLIIDNVAGSARFVRRNFSYMIKHPLIGYEDKMREKVGEDFYNYTLFIRENTPEDASILIPPQGFPWPQSGNAAYVRYFLYPRKVFSGNEYDPGKDIYRDNFDYVLLTWGETLTTQYGFTHEWPKFSISAEKIIYYDEKGTHIQKGDYNYKDFQGRAVWGVIKIKK